MSLSVSPQALEHARRSVQAAKIFADHAEAIASACAEASYTEGIVAIVDPTLGFKGIWIYPAPELHRKLAAASDGRWMLVFSAGCNLQDVQSRCKEMGEAAQERLEQLQRWTNRRS